MHDLRVAARRLRAYARFTHDEPLNRDLRRLVHATNQLRDLDLASEHGVVLVALSNARDAEQLALQRALRQGWVTRLERAIARAPSFTRKQAKNRINRLRGKIAQMPPSRAMKPRHALRRALRELQYCLEWIGEDSSNEERKQRSLGVQLDRTIVRRLRLRLKSLLAHEL